MFIKIVLILILILVVSIIGFLEIFFSLKRTQKHLLFTTEFINHYRLLVNSLDKNQLDNTAYTWIIKNVDKMQNLLGIIGVMSYRPPFASYMFSNYQVLVNTIPEIRNRSYHPTMIHTCDDILMRKYGILEEDQQILKKEISSPFKIFRKGLLYLCNLPITIAYLIGLDEFPFIGSLVKSHLFKLLSNLFAIVGFFASIISIITGWNNFIIIIKKYI